MNVDIIHLLFVSLSVPCHWDAVTLTFIVSLFVSDRLLKFQDILELGYQWSTLGSGTLLLSAKSLG